MYFLRDCKINFKKNMGITFWDFLLLYQIFFSPKVKRYMIISNKHGIYELPNDLRLNKILGK